MTNALEASERIIVLREGQNAPSGVQIVRILHEGAELIGAGAYQAVYTVVVRDAEQ